MDVEDISLNKVRCMLCHNKYDPYRGFKNIKETKVRSSRKSVKDVLNHLGKCIKGGVILLDSYYVCGTCYDKILEYDKIMIQLLAHQKELSRLLESSIKTYDDSVEDETNSIITEPLSDDSLSSAYDFGNAHNEDLNQDKKTMTRTFAESSGKSFICTQCDKILGSVFALRKHMKSHASHVQCKICGVSRRDEEYLELHMNVHEGKSEYECRYCPKRYSRKSNVIRHMHLHWDKKEFQCETCGLRFSQSNLLYNHKLAHESEETPMVCEQCDQSFKSRKTLNHHLVTHREDRPMHPCEICGKKFTEKYTLKLHLKTHKDPENDATESAKKDAVMKKQFKKEFPCIICNEVFGSRDILEKHMAVGHDVISESSIYF